MESCLAFHSFIVEKTCCSSASFFLIFPSYLSPVSFYTLQHSSTTIPRFPSLFHPPCCRFFLIPFWTSFSLLPQLLPPDGATAGCRRHHFLHQRLQLQQLPAHRCRHLSSLPREHSPRLWLDGDKEVVHGCPPALAYRELRESSNYAQWTRICFRRIDF